MGFEETIAMQKKESHDKINESRVEESIDERIETNTVVENECDSDLQYIYAGEAANIKDLQSPSVASDR